MRDWDINTPLSITAINGMSPNKNWVVEYPTRKIVLRKCVRNNSLNWLNYIAKVSEQLYDDYFPVQKVLLSYNGKRTVYRDGYYWQARDYICQSQVSNYDKNIRINKILEQLLNLHNYKNLEKGPENPNINIENIGKIENVFTSYSDLEFPIKTESRKILEKIHYEYLIAVNEFDLLEYKHLNVVPTHGDCHYNNYLFDDANNITGILDFDTFDFRPRIYDLSISAYYLSKLRSGSFEIDKNAFYSLFNNYAKQHSISRKELNLVPGILKLAFIPTKKYVNQMAKERPELIDWYINWAYNAIKGVTDQFDS